MKVEVLGPGCKRCDQLYENALSAAAEFDTAAGIDYTGFGKRGQQIVSGVHGCYQGSDDFDRGGGGAG